MKVTQVTIGRFSQFHLARQLEKHGVLDAIWTGYPKFKLTQETGIPKEKIKSFPWLHTPYMYLSSLGLNRFQWISKEWNWWDHEVLDSHVSSRLNHPTILIGLSGSGLKSGKAAQAHGGKYICHRGSSHIGFQNTILQEEYARWGFEFSGIDPRKIAKEEEEYAVSDAIVVPSEFARQTFIQKGISPHKVHKMAYGARTDRFSRLDRPSDDTFRMLWVGAVSIRKGFMDALRAFHLFSHPRKEFVVIGSIQNELKTLLAKEKTEHVQFIGTVPNAELVKYYSTSHVFILPSIEEGLANVQGEALACGCPVIATPNAGAEDLFSDGKEGFIVPVRSPEIIAEHLERLADDKNLRNAMSDSAVNRISSIRGWDSYGDAYVKLLKILNENIV